MLRSLFTPRRAPLVILTASAAALTTAFVAQYLFGLPPCELCIYQRWPYGVAAALAILALAPGRAPTLVPWFVGLAGIAFAINAGIALFHVGVEQHWWQGTASCIGNIQPTATLEELRAQIMQAPIVRCDDIVWSLFGITLAGWNALLSMLLMLFSIVAVLRYPRGKALA